MKHQPLLVFLGLALLASAGCKEPREEPVLCVIAPIPAGTAGKDVTPQSLGCDAIPATEEPAGGASESDGAPATSGEARCKLEIQNDGDSFVLVHELPEGVEPLGELKVHIETPCDEADRDVEVTHAGRTALLTGVVPPGGACAFAITATMANSTLRCDFVATTACTPACETEPQ